MDWINHIKTNGNVALREIYTLYRPECVEWVKKTYQVNEEIAKDAFQLSMVILYQNVISGKVDHLTSNLKTYLFAIVKNKTRDILKSESRYHKHGSLGVVRQHLGQDIEEKEHFEVVISKVNEAMSRMGDPCNSILKLFYFQRMKFQDIAPLVGHDHADTTKTKKYRCLKRLSTMVAEYKTTSLGL